MDDTRSCSIRVDLLSKTYRVWERPSDRFFALLLDGLIRRCPPLAAWAQRRRAGLFREFHALAEVSFEVGRGESLAIIGRNGSGKSTLLQLIAGTLYPTRGTVQVNGRIAALLELGSGFNPDFTGKENVFLNAAVLGLSRAETEARYEDICAFADIGDFIDQPVKTFSSGMVVRLAFAVAINVAADIIIVDEALAVGDINFQAKCISALRQLQSRGVTFLFVTHGIDTVKSMCQRAVYLREGRLVAAGPAPEVADLYYREMREQLSAEIRRAGLSHDLPTITATALATSGNEAPPFVRDEAFARRVASGRSGTGEARITAVQVLNEAGQLEVELPFDALLRVRIHLELHADLEFLVGYHLRNEHNLSILCTGTFTETGRVLRGQAGDHYIIEFSTRLPVRDGTYNLAVLISTSYITNRTAQFVDWAEPAAVFQVMPREPQVIWGAVYLPNQFQLWHVAA